MVQVQNKTVGMLAGGVVGLQSAEAFSDDLALVTMFYSNMGQVPSDVMLATHNAISSVFYVALVAGAAAVSWWLTKNAPDLLGSIRGNPTSPAPTPGTDKE